MVTAIFRRAQPPQPQEGRRCVSPHRRWWQDRLRTRDRPGAAAYGGTLSAPAVRQGHASARRALRPFAPRGRLAVGRTAVPEDGRFLRACLLTSMCYVWMMHQAESLEYCATAARLPKARAGLQTCGRTSSWPARRTCARWTRESTKLDTAVSSRRRDPFQSCRYRACFKTGKARTSARWS